MSRLYLMSLGDCHCQNQAASKNDRSHRTHPTVLGILELCSHKNERRVSRRPSRYCCRLPIYSINPRCTRTILSVDRVVVGHREHLIKQNESDRRSSNLMRHRHIASGVVYGEGAQPVPSAKGVVVVGHQQIGRGAIIPKERAANLLELLLGVKRSCTPYRQSR